MPGDADHLERIASKASLRALTEQKAALRDLRARAGTLLAAAAINYRLACWMSEFRSDNQVKLNRLYHGYRIAVLALGMHLILWIVQLSTILGGAP